MIATSSLIPFEIYEIAKKFSLVRIALFVLNTGIVIYLVVTLKIERAHRSKQSV